jgi:NitT/TauT family transport system permease protein
VNHGFFSIEARPSSWVKRTLPWLLFIVGIATYFNASRERHKQNAEDRIMPSLAQMYEAVRNAVLNPPEDQFTGEEPASVWQRIRTSMLWQDTIASSRRFLISLILLFPAALLGLHIGLFPYIGNFFLRFVLFFDKIIALSLLPILFIAFGIDELSKIMLMLIGVAPTVILDTINLSKSVPREQIVKGFTLGAGSFGISYRIVLKQIFPRVLNSIRLNLKPLMLFLFAGEMIASTDGLAYRIALLRRHLAMDVIIPYVLWVAILLFVIDAVLRWLNRRLHPWFLEA